MAAKQRKLKRDARILKRKALASLRLGLSAFNSHEEDGRIAAVLLHFQHAAEMLLKAGLIQRGQTIFDKETSKSKGFKACLNLAPQHLKSSASECGVLRAIDAMRDTEQHWYAVVPEEILYTECRAVVTAIDEILSRIFGERLNQHLPTRILPISTMPPPADVANLFESKCAQIRELLKPGKRQRDEARGLIRTLLAMEAHVVDEVEVRERDVNRVESGIRSGKSWDVVFPRLAQIVARFEGEGAAVVVHISKTEGAPVKLISADDPSAAEAPAIREIDLSRRYRYSSKEPAEKLGLDTNRLAALKRHLKFDEDARSSHCFTFGSQKHWRYSDDGLQRLRQATKDVDVNQIYRDSLKGRKRKKK